MSIKKKQKIFQMMRLIQITDVLCNTSVKYIDSHGSQHFRLVTFKRNLLAKYLFGLPKWNKKTSDTTKDRTKLSGESFI